MKPTQADTLDIRTGELLRASFLFEAIIHPVRQRIFNALLKEGGLTAAGLAQKLYLEQSLCLQQLSILCGVGLLLRAAEEEPVFYTVNYTKMEMLYAAAEALLF